MTVRAATTTVRRDQTTSELAEIQYRVLLLDNNRTQYAGSFVANFETVRLVTRKWRVVK